jgi:cell shape-determining protein MreC
MDTADCLMIVYWMLCAALIIWLSREAFRVYRKKKQLQKEIAETIQESKNRIAYLDGKIEVYREVIPTIEKLKNELDEARQKARRYKSLYREEIRLHDETLDYYTMNLY